jgi:RNA polymerase sigma factor (sigma-70 family)
MIPTSPSLIRYLRKLAAPQSYTDWTDPQLLEQFLMQRSEAAFSELVRRHGPMVLHVCRRVLHHAQDAEDAFQATFLVLARKAGSIRKQESVGSFLHGVAYRMAQRLKVKESRRRTLESSVASASTADAMDDITWRELRRVLDDELRKLPEKYRTPLILCYLEGKTRDEAARQLDWTKAVFRRRLERGRDLLGRRLTRRGITLSTVLSASLLTDVAAQAALPPLLAASTVRAGLAAALGQATEALVSAQVAALVESGTCSLLAKKASVAVVLLMSLALGVGGLLAHRAVHSRTLAEAPAAPKAAPPPQPLPARSASKDQAIEITGRVFGSDGKVLQGAHVYLWTKAIKKKDDLTIKATTGADGRFHFAVSKADLAAGAKVLATAKGQGPDWIELARTEQPGEVTLRLVEDDVSIVGRILDLEGQPIAGVSVTVGWMEKGDIKPLLKPGKGGSTRSMISIGSAALDGPVSVQTGKDGRFRLSGFGHDRIAILMVRGAGVEDADLPVLTHAGPVSGTHDNRTVSAAAFTHIAAPTKPIIGTVRDKRTGKPLVGIRVLCPWKTFDWCRTTTDEKGRYRVVGLGKLEKYDVAAGGAPYFCTTKFGNADTPGLDPITVDFALERGVAVTGRVTDKATGLPVRGEVIYYPLADNANLKDFTDFAPRGIGPTEWQGKIAADGTFTVVCVPGPGLLWVRADDDNYVRARREGYKIISGYILGPAHAVVRIDPSEQDAKSRTCAIALKPGRSLGGTLVGPDGQPVAGTRAAGLRSIPRFFFPPEKLEAAGFTVGGLSPEQPRPLLFVHPEKKLAKVHTIRSEEKEPLTVRLEAMGALSGRIVDAKGVPRAGLKLAAEYQFLEERERCIREGKEPKDLPWELLLNDYSVWRKIINRVTTADRDGKFRLEGLVPGIEYYFEVSDGQTMVFNREHLSVQSGKVNDLGDLKLKPDPAKEGEK